jgi:hypothetical protein
MWRNPETYRCLCHRHASVPDACSIRGLIGKPDLIGMVMHMGRRRDVGSMGVNGWVCMSCPHQLRASLVAETGALIRVLLALSLRRRSGHLRDIGCQV